MNKFFTVILSLFLLMPTTSWADDNESITNSYKQPISKRKIVKKFLYAMGGVGISSFAIYFLLTVYNRIRDEVLISDKDKILDSPDDLNSALKVFLEKSDWK